MANVLVFNFPGEGHINPTIALIEELIERGEQVVYYCIEDYRTKIEKTGAEFRPYENFLPGSISEKDRKDFNPQEMVKRLVKGMDEVIDEVLPVVKAEDYDYVIYDNNFAAGKIIAEQLQIPAISSCTTFALNKKVMEEFMKNRENMKMEIPEDNELTQILKKWQERYQFSVHSFPDVMNQPGELTLVYTSELYQPFAEEFDESFTFVGPSLKERKDVESFSFEDLPDKPLIYISMGTVFNDQPEFYQKCFEAFKDSSATVLMSVGKKTDIRQFGDIPDNVDVYNYVPQLDVLQHADVFITHGGMNSSSEGLYFGVPMIVIPAGGDQPIIAERIEELEAGIHVEQDEVDAAKLNEAADRILSHSAFAENSRKVGESLKNAGGYKKAVEEVLRFKRQRQIQ